MDSAPALDKRLLRVAFEKAAPGYDAAAVLQHEVCQRMLSRLDFVKLQPSVLLDAGCGTGNVVPELAARFPRATLYALDIATAMVQRACARVPWWKRALGRGVVPVCGDIERLPLRAAYQGTDRYTHVNRFIDMHDIGDMLVHAGFADPVMDMEYITLTYADVRAVMHDLKAIGAHNVTAGRRQGMTARATFAAVERNYEGFRQAGRLPATFEVIYGHAWLPQKRTTPDGRRVIDIKPHQEF